MTMFHTIHEALETESSKGWHRMTVEERDSCVPLFKRAGSNCRYPWIDPSFKVGDSFFKAVSREELEADKLRPSCPKNIKEQYNVNWMSRGHYNKIRKQYGYTVVRTA